MNQPITSAAYICGWDRCEKHDTDLHGYPCHNCGEDWKAANPKTVQAIRDFARGKASHATIQKARLADAKDRAKMMTAEQTSVRPLGCICEHDPDATDYRSPDECPVHVLTDNPRNLT